MDPESNFDTKMVEELSKADFPQKIIKCKDCKQKSVVSENDNSMLCDRCKAHAPFDGYNGSNEGDEWN